MKKYVLMFLGTLVLCSLLFVVSVSATDLGYVKQTDIVTFIDYSPIESYNYKNKTYIIAEDLMNYGFDVVWDNQNRELRIDRQKYNFTPYISDFVNQKKEICTFKDLYKVYPTDIKTYVNGELAEAYNISGRTVVNIDFMYHWGNCIYDDSARKYEVRILEKEIDGFKEDVLTVDESTDYYKYIKTQSDKGVYENGELVYGIKKTVTTNKYGDNVDILFGNFKEGKTLLYSKSYMYSNAMVNYNLSSPAKISVEGDSVIPGYTINLLQKSVAKTVQDNSFKYGLVINKISPVLGSDGSEAMYLRGNGDLYAIKYKSADADGFDGELFKDGKSIYKGKVYYDRFTFQFHNYGHLENKNFVVLYAPSYTDAKGVIYYNDESVDGAGSIYYIGNVVNGVAHGEGVIYAYGARNYETYSDKAHIIYKENGQTESIKAAGDNVLYIGGFFNGLLNGYGKMYNQNGAISCEGNWTEGMMNGEGTFYTNINEDSSGLLYEGNIKNNKRHGYGIEYASKGNPLYEGVYQRFVGEFNDGNWYKGKWYELEYNAAKNLHDVYLYYEGEFRYDGGRQYGIHYKYYNEQTGLYEKRTGYFENWKYVN